MIINISRAKVARTCWRKTFNLFHRELEGSRSLNLVDGGAMHDGIAQGLASRDWNSALVAARERFDKDKQTVTVLPEESFIFDAHWKLVQRMVECYAENHQHEQYEVIQPECQFDVELPGTMHNCIWLHWYDAAEKVAKWGPPPPEKILQGNVLPAHIETDKDCRCYTPHRLVGKTDAVVMWTINSTRNLWLEEHKSTAISGELFWKQFVMDRQPTAYIYGINKMLGIRPRGVIVNAIFKPSEKQVSNWNSKRKYGPAKTIKDYISYERQPFLRTEEDLAEFEAEIINTANEWEERITSGNFPREVVPGHCLQWNRECDYYFGCMSHEEPGWEEALQPRAADYVTEKLYNIIGIKPPSVARSTEEEVVEEI